MSEPISLAAPMPIPSDGFWARLRHTPLRDALRGRVNARLDARRVIVAAELPEPLAGLAWLVTCRARLKREEKLDVARELAGHFRDGLDAGRSPEELARDFGDPRAAARLIRRAKLRARPWKQRALRRTMQGVGLLLAALIVAYLGLSIRYLLARPTVSHDYVAELNVAPQLLPEGDRAWPLYRRALLAMQPAPSQLRDPALLSRSLPGEESPDWPALLDYVERNQEPLTLIRAAAARPHLGFVYGDPADRRWLKRTIDRESALPGSDELLVGLLLPHVNELNQARMILRVDAARALASGDREALLADVRALLGIGRQLPEDSPFLVVQLNALAMFNDALRIVGETLAVRPDLLTDGDLRDLAHEFAAYNGGGPIRLSFDGERRMFHDLFQRMYTDDGAGDGYLTSEGLDLIQSLTGANLDRNAQATIVSAMGPILSVAVAGRHEMTALAERLLDQARREQGDPLWTWTESATDRELHAIKGDKASALRYLPILLVMPDVQSVGRAAEYATQRRDALWTALALVLFHRRHAAWPASLDELTPDLLPAVPPDRFNGKPLGYRLIDGHPRLYSVGHDLVDDDGQTEPSRVQISPGEPPRVYPADSVAVDDWILWPPVDCSPAPPVEPPSVGDP
jgi:hypothetical protein